MILTILSMMLGILSAFFIFAMGFNGSPFTYQICLFILIAIFSAMVGRLTTWRRICWSFYIPHLPLFALLILGSLEKGQWGLNLSLIFLPHIAIWLPAYLTSKLGNKKTPAEPTR